MLLAQEDLVKLLEEHMATSAGKDVDDELRAYGVDPDAYLAVCLRLTHLVMVDVTRAFMFRDMAKLRDVIFAHHYSGFILGVKSAMEIEMRRVADAS